MTYWLLRVVCDVYLSVYKLHSAKRFCKEKLSIYGNEKRTPFVNIVNKSFMMFHE